MSDLVANHWYILGLSKSSQKGNNSVRSGYIVRDKEGKVVIYEIQDDESEKEYEVTDISTEYLTETDKNNIKKGIYVNGKQDLNQLIEDFE